MKKIISLLLVLAFVLCFTSGCVLFIPGCSMKTLLPKIEETTGTAETGKNNKRSKKSDVDPDTVTPLIWHVTDTDGDGEMYLFGTIHAGDERSEIAVDNVSKYIDECDSLAVEFDVVAYQEDTERMVEDLAEYLLDEGKITDYLSEETYEAAKAILRKAHMYIGLYDRYGLAFWSELVDSAMIEAYSDISTENAVDTLLISYAYDHDIDVLEVESYEFQSALLSGFSDEFYVYMIENTISDPEAYGELLNDLYEHWTAGDEQAMIEDLIIEEESCDEEELSDGLIAELDEYTYSMYDERNLGMADKAEEYLASGGKTFFAVGEAHMLGEAGIVSLLTERGYTVEPVNWN